MFAWYPAGMKPRDVLPVVALVVAAQLHTERESAECKEPPCALGQNVIMPEPQHAPGDPPADHTVPIRMVEVGSPVVSVPWGSDYHLLHLRINGQTLEDAL